MPRRFVIAGVASLLLATSLSPTRVSAAAPSLVARVVQSGLVHPWDIAFAPGGQMIVTERPGRIKVYADGSPGAPLLATSTVPDVRAEGEAGLMGIAVDPKFSTNRRIYVCASRTYGSGWYNQVIKYRLNGQWEIDARRILVKKKMRADQKHNGCAVEFGADGKLWVSMGEIGTPNLAQRPTSKMGKILRMKRDGSAPAGNPIMPGTTARTIIYSMGHRNPQGIAFQPATNRVYAVEHGPDHADEINWIRTMSGNGGRNYGWPCVTGFGNEHNACSGDGPFTNPAWESGDSTIATSGATFLRGRQWGPFEGHLVVAQLKEQDLRRFSVSSSGAIVTRRAKYFDGRFGRLRAAVIGNRDRLWLSTSNGVNDKIIRVIPSR